MAGALDPGGTSHPTALFSIANPNGMPLNGGSIAAPWQAKQLERGRSFHFPLYYWMTRTMRKKRTESAAAITQLPLNFDVFTIDTPSGVVAAAGETELDAGIRQAVNSLLDRCVGKGLSRERVADRLAERLSRPITKAQLDQWVAPSQADRRIPVDVWIALMMVATHS